MMPRLFSPVAVPARQFTPADVRRANKRNRNEILVGELVELYLRHCKVEDVHTPLNRHNRERVLREFVQLHGATPALYMRPYHLTDFVEAHEGWKEANTRRTNASMVQAAFQWAVNQRRIGRNPFKSVHYPEGERRPEMTDDVFRRLAAAANKAFERFMWMLRYTGCREGELCRAVWADVSLDRGIWVVDKHKTRKHTKKSKWKALVPQAVDLLRSLQAVQPHEPADRVLLNNRGRPWTPGTVQTYARRLKARFGVPEDVTMHSIRHQWATTAIVNGAPPALVAEQLGHANSRTVEKYYLHLAGQPEAVRAAAKLALPRE